MFNNRPIIYSDDIAVCRGDDDGSDDDDAPVTITTKCACGAQTVTTVATVVEPENTAQLRVAGEVFIFMHRNFRVSRNIRAHWLFDHLNKKVRIDPDSQKDEKYGNEMSVIGIVPKGGSPQEDVWDEDFVVNVDTKITYISRYYRHVYVLDLSPSTIVADDVSDCCLCTRLIKSLGDSMISAVKGFTVPGTTRMFQPQIYISVLVFVPFISFESDLVLVQGVLLTESNVSDVLATVKNRFQRVFHEYYKFVRPALQRWGRLKRRYKNYKFDSLCEPDDVLGAEEARAFDPRRRQRDEADARTRDQPENLMEFTRGQWRLYADAYDDLPQDASVDGYVLPEWSLVFMLRLGLLATQMLPENTQSNVIIITDAVCGMPDSAALQRVLTQLRSYTIACSFIQLQARSSSEPVFGHVASCELLHFLAMATFGTYLPNCGCVQGADGVGETEHVEDFQTLDEASDEDSETNELHDLAEVDEDEEPLAKGMKSELETARNEPQPREFEPLNSFHRALICWCFQNALSDNEHITKTIFKINPVFAELHKQGVGRHCQLSTTYRSTLHQLLYVRLREGFTLKAASFADNGRQITVVLCLPFRPLVFVEYIIQSPWPAKRFERCDMHVELIIQAPFNELKNLLIEGPYLDPTRVPQNKSIVDSIIEADRLLMHIHSFNMDIDFYSIPSGVTINYALFNVNDRIVTRQTNSCLTYLMPNELKTTRRFLAFWRVLLDLNDATWQKWVHTHSERLVLNVDVPFNVFNCQESFVLNLEEAVKALRGLVKLCSSFCLINGFTYVTFSYPDNPVKTTHDGELLADVQRGASNHGRPDFFYMTRLSSDKTAAIVLKTAFLGGISTTIRRKTVDDLRNKLMRLTYDDDPERPVLSIIRRPLERILVKYSEMPADLRTITRVHEDTDNEDEVKHIIMHNALSKCLKCKRTVVVLADLQVAGGAFESRLAADLALNVILKRRLADGYKPVWVQNNIVGLCRQVCTTNGNALEQYVLFPPSTITLPLLRHRARLGTHHDSRRVNLRPPFSSTRALAIVTEYWSEPGGDIDHPETNVENEEKSHPRYQATPSLEDNDVVSLLYTVDRLLRVCGDVDDATATRVAVGERRDGQVLLDADGRDYFSRLVAPDPDDDDALPEDKTAVDAAKSVFAEWRRWDDDFVAMPCYKHELSPRSKYVNVYKQMLCPANLFQFTPRHLLTIGPFCTDPTNKEAAQVMLETVIDELEAFSDAWFNVMNPHLWPILTRRAARDNKDEKIYKHKTKRKCRLFLRRVSPWAFGLIAVPETVDDLHDGKLPIAVHICCEPQLAYCVAMNQFQRGNLRPLDKIPVEWFVKTRCRPNSVWADTNAEDGKAFEAMTLAGFLKMVREEVVSRTRIQTIFSLCRRRIEVLESETREMQEDAYIIDMEMESVPNALRTFCRHLQDSGEPESDNCADKTNLPDMFEQVVGRSFSHVPGAPTIYYCDYKLTSEDRKRVRRRQKKEARLDEKRRRQRETREREKKERELDMERAKAERDSPDYDETKGWAEEKRRMDEEEKRKQRMEKRKMKKQRRRRDLAPRRQSLSRRSLTNTSEGDESPLVSRQVDDESDDEWDVRREPLFLQFQCTLKFPDGVSETFALDTMPACVNQLLARSRHKAERDRLWHEATDVVMDTIDVERRRIEEVKRTRSAKQEVLDVDDEKSHRRNVFLIDAVTCVDDEDDELRRPYWLDMRELDVCLEIVVVTQKPLTERGLILKKTTSHGKKKKRLLQQTSSSSDDPLLTLVNDDANFYNRLLNNDAVSDSGDSFFSTTSWASCASINSDIGDDVPWPSEYEYTSSSEDLDDERDVPSTSSSRPNEEHEHHHHHRRRRRRVSHRRRRGDEKPPYVDLAQVSDAKLYALAKAIASHLVVGGLPEVHRCTKLSGDDSDCDDYVTAIERTKAFHAYLPKKESVELKSLVSSLNGLMEMERVLVRSRNCDITIEMLSQISSFISKEVKKGHGVVRMVERSKPIVLVMCTEAAELRLLELLDGARMNFAKLVRCGDSPIYYCSRVDDVDACITSYRQRTTTAATTTTTQPMAQNEYAFDYTEDDEELREKGRHERGSQTKKLVEQMVAQELRRRVGKAKMKQMAAAAVQGNAAVDVQMANDDKLGTAQKDVLFDFWLILTVKQTFNMQFCQRYEAHQSALPQAVWDKCRSALRVVNQELLLDRLYETRWCDPLLLPVDEDERVRIQRPYSMATVMNNDDDAENDDDDGSKATTSTTTTLIRRKDDSSDDSGKNDDDDDDDDDDESDDTDTDSDRASVLRLCAVTTKLPSSTPPAAFVDTYGECDDYRDDLGPPISDLARYTYSPGHFACMAKAHLWFTVPPRLRANNSPVSSSTSSTSALSSSLQFAYDSLRPALEQFAVRNIPNMYVVKDDDTGDVMYMMLHIRPETYVASICMQQVPPTATHLEYVARRMERDILMTIFGVRRPSVAIAKQLRDAVQKRLEYVLLQNMLTLFAKNSSMRLLAHDVQFLQRDVMQPSLMKFFSIPALFKGHLASFLYYVHQHMQVIMTIAKLRDDFSLVGGTRGPKAGPPCRLKSYPAPKGKMPAKYTPTFFLYVKVPKSGSADYGVAIVEIRVVNQDGTIAVSLPEGRNNSETHKLLARPLPASARNKYFRVITKTHKAEAPEKWACDVCGYLQVVAWKVGVLQLDLLEDALQQVAEVALCDVVTEFGFLNAAIIESGASVPPSPRAAPIQTQRLSAKLSSPAEARSSLGHKRDSHDLQPPPTPQAKTGIFTFDTSAVRMSTSSAAAGGSGGGQIVARRGSTASELDKLAIREELTRDAPREPDFVSLRTATTLCEWFEFCASKAGDTNAVFADTIAFDCPSSALPTLLEIRRAIANELGTVETMRENVYLCTWAAGDSRHGSTTSTSTSTTMTTSTTTTTTNIVDGRFECIQSAQPGCLSGDYGVISTTVHPIEHVMVSFIKEVAVETLRFGFDPVGDTPDMLKRLHEYPSALFAPLTEERSFVPRQRMMFAVMRGASFTMYFYNFHPSVSDRIRHIARMALLWHNARTRLLREIGLHKMGITHLSPLLPGGQNTYETLVWTDPGKLINTDYPPEEVRMPEFSQLPVEYSNYLFRLYRRPYGMDANEKPAKRMRHPKMRCPETSTPHQRRQDCLVSSTFDQMLRLRQRVADRLNTVRKATALHNHFLNGNNDIEEELFLMLLGAEKAPQKREPPTLPTDPRLLGRLRGGGGGSASGGTGPSGGCGGGGFGGGGGRFGGGGAGGATTGSIRSCPNGVVRHFSGGGGVVSVGGGRYFGGGPCGSLLRQFSGGACKSLGPRRQSSVSGGRQSFGRVRSSGGHASGLIPMPAAVGRGKFLPRQTSATTTRSATVSARAKVRAKRRRETPMATVVHSVKSPILFFPSWRNMLAGVRGETEERRLLNIEGHGEEAPRQSNVSYSQWQQQNSRSNTADHKKKKGKVSSRKRRTSTHVLEDDSVIILKLLYGLVKEYMSYLLAIGFRPIDVAGDRIFRTKLRKGSNKFPYIVMYQCFDAGLVFLSISFSPPYLMLKLHVFRRAFYAAFNAKTGKEAAKRQVDLHKIVSRLKRRCHVHSFTYDFHLRVLNRCLLRDRNVTPLFPSGLRTIEFLGDFIDYYGSRPISSRNCIHEERIQQCLLVDLNNDDLWAHFLLNGEQLGFNQIMRFKKSNTLGTPDPLDCVLVAREDICQELQNVRIVLYVRKVNPKDRICRTFRLLFFNMFIDSADVAPLAEEMEMYEESRKYYRRKARAVKRAMFLEDADRDEDEETFKTMRFDASSPSREPSPEQQQAPRTSSRSPTPSPAAGRRSSPAPEDEPALENVALPNPEPMSGLELGADLESTADVEFRPVPGTTRENHSEAEKESDVDGIGQVGKDDAASRGAYEPSEGTTSIRGAETAIEAVRSTSRVAEASPASGQILFRNSISAPPTLVSPNRDSHSRRRDKSKDKDRNASGKSVSSMRAQDVRRVGSRSPIPESSAFDVRDSDSDTESALGTGSDPDSESTPKWKRTKRGASGILNFGDIELEIRKKFRSFWSRLDADDGLEQAAEAIKSDVVDLLPTSPTATTMPRDYKKRQRTSPDDDGGDDDVDDVDDDDDPPMEDWVDELLHEAKKYERAQSRARDKVTTSAAVVEEPPATKVVDEVDVAVVVADNRRRIETLMRCGVLPMMDDVELDNVAVGTVYGGGRLTEDGLCALESRHQVMNSEPFAELAAMYAAHLLTDVQRPDSPAVLMNSAEPDLPMSTAIVELGDASTTSSVVPTRKDSLLFTMLRDKLTMQRQVAVDEQIRQELPQLGQCNELNFPPYEVDADEAVDRYEFHDFDEHGIDVIALAYGDTYAYAERGVSVPMRIGVRSESSDVYDGVAESSKRRYASGPTWMYGEDGAEPAPRSSSMWLHHGSLEAEVLLMPDGRERAERAMYEAAWLPITTYTAAAAAAAVGGRRPRRTPPPFGVAPTIPLDRAVHVQYSSLRQQSIQRQLERTTSFFRRRMQTMISNAERHCRVDSLWRRARDPPNEDSAKDAVGSAKKGAKRKRYDDPYRAIRCVEKNHMSPKELATLMLLIRLHLVHDYMPRLEHVLKQANCSRLCKFLVLHFGMSRCRFYDLSALHTKYLMVTNTKDENRMFVVACKGVVGPDVFVAIKERAEDLLDFERLAPKKCPTTSSPDSSSESSSSASRTSSDSQSQLQSQSASTVSLGSESDVSSDESTSPPPPPPPPTSPPMNEIDTTYDTVEGFAKLLVGFMWSDVILNPVERRTLALADWSTRIVDVAAIDVDKDHPANKSVRQNSSSGVGCTN